MLLLETPSRHQMFNLFYSQLFQQKGKNQYLKQCFLTRDDSAPQGHITVPGDIFGCHNRGRQGLLATRIQWVETRDAANSQQCTGELPKRMFQLRISIVSRLKNSKLKGEPEMSASESPFPLMPVSPVVRSHVSKLIMPPFLFLFIEKKLWISCSC